MSENILKQYRYYLSGSIVPDFQNYVWDRTEENSLSIIKGFYHGGGIRGINIDDPYVFSDDNIFTIRVDQTVPKIPGKLQKFNKCRNDKIWNYNWNDEILTPDKVFVD